MFATASLPARLSLAQMQSLFEAILPRIETHARIYFRSIRCPHLKADRIAETIALAFKWFRRLLKQGKDPTAFVSTLATYAAKAVKSGRRLAGQMKAKDVMNKRTQARKGFCIVKLPDRSTLNTNPLAEALIDNTQSPVPDQVQFRLDFPAWLRTYCQRDRRIIQDMARSERTLDLAQKYGLSRARISQKRGEYRRDWMRFTDDRPDSRSIASN
jgi:hypothetical protein